MTDYACSATEVEIRRGGHVIVPSISFTIPRGCLFGLVGPSGAGKTTIMRAMIGLGAIHAGTLTILDRPAGSAELRHHIGYLPQNGGVWPDLTTVESLRFFARMYDVPLRRIDDVLGLMHLGEAAYRPLATLSGGQERRAALAMAILHRPEFLVLDEPTIGLDPRMRHQLWQEFRHWTSTGDTLLISTHVMAEAEQCDLVAVIQYGCLVAYGPPADLVSREGAVDLEDAVLRVFEREGTDVTRQD